MATGHWLAVAKCKSSKGDLLRCGGNAIQMRVRVDPPLFKFRNLDALQVHNITNVDLK